MHSFVSVCIFLCNFITCIALLNYQQNHDIQMEHCHKIPTFYFCIAMTIPSLFLTLDSHYSSLYIYNYILPMLHEWNYAVCTLLRMAFHSARFLCGSCKLLSVPTVCYCLLLGSIPWSYSLSNHSFLKDIYVVFSLRLLWVKLYEHPTISSCTKTKSLFLWDKCPKSTAKCAIAGLYGKSIFSFEKNC